MPAAIPQTRPDDLRERSHNTPRSHRIGASDAARRAQKVGGGLRVTFVMIGAGDNAFQKPRASPSLSSIDPAGARSHERT